MGEMDINNVPFGQTLKSAGGFGGQVTGHQLTLGKPNDRKKLCILHNQPLRYFCESCEELICYDCTVMGPHNTQLHRISSIDEAFKYKFDSVNK